MVWFTFERGKTEALEKNGGKCCLCLKCLTDKCDADIKKRDISVSNFVVLLLEWPGKCKQILSRASESTLLKRNTWELNSVLLFIVVCCSKVHRLNHSVFKLIRNRCPIASVVNWFSFNEVQR